MTPDDVVSVPVSSLADLAIEHWRLSAWLTSVGGDAAPTAGPARHALRRIGDLLRKFEVEVRPLDGLPFDPGLAARVVDTVPDATLPPGKAEVAETLSPLVLFRGAVARPADVVVRTG